MAQTTGNSAQKTVEVIGDQASGHDRNTWIGGKH